MSSNKRSGGRRAVRRSQSSDGIRPVRVRAKALASVQEDKLALAFYLIARDLVEDRTEPGAEPEAPASEEQS